jgi:hypothetical protein
LKFTAGTIFNHNEKNSTPNSVQFVYKQ